LIQDTAIKNEILPFKEKELLASSNPFALVCLAVKYSNAAKNIKELRFKFKRKLIRLSMKREVVVMRY